MSLLDTTYSDQIGKLNKPDIVRDLVKLQSTAFNQRITYVIIMTKDEDGRFIVTSRDPNLQGMVTDGSNENEAIKNAIEAINAILETRSLDNKYNITIRYT